MVCCFSSRPLFPGFFREPNCQCWGLSESAHEGQAEQQRFGEELLGPSRRGRAAAFQPKLVKTLRFAVDQCFEAEALDETLQLTLRQLPFHQVHEVRTRATLGKE